MSKVYLFLKKLLALSINALVFGVLTFYGLPWFYTLPGLILAFSIICSRILIESPKELYNFQRSEKFFTKGGLRDLVRIPVVLFAFLHDVVVWEIWGIYQVFLMIVDLIHFIKIAAYYILHAFIWFALLLVPFWRILIYSLFFYIVKWPWWIYRYAYRALLKTFNRNILRVSFWASLITLLTIQTFYFLDITLNLSGLRYIGIILALLPLSWIFGEISAMRAQKLLNAPYFEVKFKFRNGLETVRGVLFFLTFFVVLLLAQIGLNLTGWIPKSGIIFIGLVININLIINLIQIFLVVLITLGTIVLPTYRLYNEFSETSLMNISQILSHIGKRILQIISGFVPASFFGLISIVPVSIIVFIALFATVTLKNNVTDVKIEKLLKEKQASSSSINEHHITKQLIELTNIRQFPIRLLQEMKHRPFLKEEIESGRVDLSRKNQELLKTKESLKQLISATEKKIADEKTKIPAINQTRIEELSDSLTTYKNTLKNKELSQSIEINKKKIDVDFANRQYKQLPVIFYLSSLFFVVVLTFVFTFLFGFLGNFFYNAFVFRNDNQPAYWKEIIDKEKKIDPKQPLLSTTLNIIIIAVILLILFYSRFTPLVEIINSL